MTTTLSWLQSASLQATDPTPTPPPFPGMFALPYSTTAADPKVFVQGIDALNQFQPMQGPPLVSTNAPFQMAFNPAGNMLAVAYNTNPTLVVFRRDNTSFPSPVFQPTITQASTSLAWSPTGKILVLATSTTPYLYAYAVSGSTFTPITLPTIPNLVGNTAISFSPSGKYLAVFLGNQTTTTSNVQFLAVNPDNTFTNLGVAANHPTGWFAATRGNPAWTADDNYIAFNGATTRVVKRTSETTFEFLPALASATTVGRSPIWTPDGNWLLQPMLSAPFWQTYQRSGDTFTLTAGILTVGSNICYGTAFTTSNRLFRISGNQLFEYQYNGGSSFTHLSTTALPYAVSNGQSAVLGVWPRIPYTP